jgi:hypothetical protein
MGKKKESQSGKGDAPRNCHSSTYRDNYDDIKWNKNVPVQSKINKSSRRRYC